jgi:hypothetical protein
MGLKKVATADGFEFIQTEGITKVKVVNGRKEGNEKLRYISVLYKDSKDSVIIGPYNSDEAAENVIINDLMVS